MISIITTLILTGVAWYNGIDFPRLVCLFIMGLCASLGVNWFFRAGKMKKSEAASKFTADDFKTIDTYNLRTMEKGEPKYLYYARDEVSDGKHNVVFNCSTKNGPFKERHIPAEIVTFVADCRKEPHVRLVTATKWVWGDIWQSIIPCKFYSIRYELHIPLQ